MKKLSLRRAMSFVVIAAMMLAVLASPVNAAPPPASEMFIDNANIYDYDATKAIMWASNNGEATIGDLLGVAPFFTWFAKALLQYDDTARAFEVIEVEAPGTDAYASWTLGYGRIIVMAHDSNTNGVCDTIQGLNPGDMFYYVGNYDADMSTFGAVNITLTAEETEGSWVKPPKPELGLGFNIYGDVNTFIADNAGVVAALTDGEWALDATSFSAEGIKLLHNDVSHNGEVQPVISLVWIFEEETTVEAFKLGFYSEWYSMIGLPVDEIEVYTADEPAEGEDPFWWYETSVSLGLAETEREEAIGETQVAELVLEEALTSKYFKLDLVFDEGPWAEAGRPIWEFMAMTEAEIVLAEDTGDDNTGDDNTGDDNTGDDNTGDNTGDDNTGDEGGEVDPPKAGDASNMAVFAILALVAVLGSAVVVRNRK